MYLKPVSFDGLALNDANYETIIPDDAPVSPRITVNENRRTNAFPQYASIEMDGVNLPLAIKIKSGGSLSELKRVFNPVDYRIPSQKKLIVSTETGELWSVMGVSQLFTETSQKKAIAVLRISNPVWVSDIENTTSWNVTAGGQTKSITINSNAISLPKIEITPTGTNAGSYAVCIPIIVRNRKQAGAASYPLQLLSNWDTAALITADIILQPDCADTRLVIDGVESDFWLVRPNAVDSALWANINLSPAINLKLGTAILDSGSVTEVIFAKGYDSLLKKLPAKGILQIGNEVFFYNGPVEPKKRKVRGVSRAEWNTSAAAHAVDDPVYWIEHDIRLLYGSPNATAMVNDETKKPAFDLEESTNTEWIYHKFGDKNNLSPASWSRSLSSSKKVSEEYVNEENAGDEVWPAEVMGSLINSLLDNKNKPVGDTATIVWEITNPFGFYSVDLIGKKYKVGSAWPGARIEKTADSKKWASIFTNLTPATQGAWTDFDTNEILLNPTANYVPIRIRIVHSGTVSSSIGAMAMVETREVILKPISGNIPLVTVCEDNVNVQLDAVLTNMTSPEDDAIRINYPCRVNKKMTIDSEKKIIDYDGAPADSALTPYPNRGEWLPLLPGENVLQFDADYTGNLAIVIKWRERMLY
jgi:hypothetical protein